ncbi:MAG: ABC transporter substrate-binding protein, partial [Actinomycetota bacterium]
LACAQDEPVVISDGEETESPAVDSCATENLNLVTPGTLTIGTDNPAFPPYFSGGETDEHDWKFNDPYTGEGFESAVAYEVAERLGFSADQVVWAVVPFNQTYKPGPKDYDFAIEQISYSDKRAGAVDFSESYYDVNQALVAVKGTPITTATSIDELKDYVLAAPIGTTSYDYIVETIVPNNEPGAYNTLADTVAALNAGQVDGIMVDFPTAVYLADPFVQEVKDGVVVGQFETAVAGEYFGMTLEKGNTLVACLNQALGEMKSDGTLAAIEQEWLSEKTNVGEVPVLG